jgi:hypothetical protein
MVSKGAGQAGWHLVGLQHEGWAKQQGNKKAAAGQCAAGPACRILDTTATVTFVTSPMLLWTANATRLTLHTHNGRSAAGQQTKTNQQTQDIDTHVKQHDKPE